MTKLLSIEIDTKHEFLEMHLNKIGAEELKNLLSQLIDHNKRENTVLMTSEFGGDELTSDPQNMSNNFKLLNRLKVFYWE